ncbi:MAG: hypothetical protein JO313_12655 [Verrucomicrobia bacterium]|nr:hypothetical protein [Verrucomicrobiota bacterium]
MDQASNAETANWPRPRSFVENGPAAALLVGYVRPSFFLNVREEMAEGKLERDVPSYASPARSTFPAAHLNATTSPLYARRCTTTRMKGSGDAGVRFVDEHEVLVHPFGIERPLEHEQVLCPNQAMLHSRLKMKPVARSKCLDGERLVGGTPKQDKPGAFLDQEVFVLLLVHLKSEVSTLTDYEILFDPRVLIENNDHTSPRRLYDAVATSIDTVEKLRKKGDRSHGPIAELLIPERARLSAIAIERLPGVDARLAAQTRRDGGELGITGKLIVIKIKTSTHLEKRVSFSTNTF